MPDIAGWYYDMLGRWAVAWGIWGTHTVSAYLLCATIVAFSVGMVATWSGFFDCHYFSTGDYRARRFTMTALAGAAWPVPLVGLTAAIMLAPLCGAAYLLWKWNTIHEKAHVHVDMAIQRRRDARVALTAPFSPAWGQPTAEAVAEVEKMVSAPFEESVQLAPQAPRHRSEWAIPRNGRNC